MVTNPMQWTCYDSIRQFTKQSNNVKLNDAFFLLQTLHFKKLEIVFSRKAKYWTSNKMVSFNFLTFDLKCVINLVYWNAWDSKKKKKNIMENSFESICPFNIINQLSWDNHYDTNGIRLRSDSDFLEHVMRPMGIPKETVTNIGKTIRK